MLEIRLGYRFVVMVNRDTRLRADVDRRTAGDATGVGFGPVVQSSDRRSTKASLHGSAW